MPILARPFPARRGLATPGFMRQSGPCRSTPDLAAGVLSAEQGDGHGQGIKDALGGRG